MIQPNLFEALAARQRSRLTGAAAMRQRGVTLIELMVGITIGLLTVLVALSSLMLSRSISGTVSEVSQLQQQASYAFRVIGQQIRQAGSIKLNLAFNKDATATVDAGDVVAFETSFNRAASTVTGRDAPTSSQYSMVVGYQNYQEASFPSEAQASFFRDCLGQQPSGTLIQSSFVLVKATGATTGELRCAGTDNTARSLISKVADFRVRYLQQAGAVPTMQYVNATTAATDWSRVFAVEVCMEMVGDENIPTNGSTYRDCGWAAGDAEKDRGNRTRLVLRSVYQIRSQGAV